MFFINENYEIGTGGGNTKNWLDRTSFERTKFTRLQEIDISKEESVNIREIVLKLSVVSG